MTLGETLAATAEQCEKDGVEISGEQFGPVHRWVERNVKYNQGQSFWIVTLLTAELADRKARREGYKNQGDKAATLAFKGKS